MISGLGSRLLLPIGLGLSLTQAGALARDAGTPVNASAAPASLDERLRSMNLYVRAEAAREVGRLGPAGAIHVPILTDMVLSSPRDDAAVALGMIGSAAAPAVPALLTALEDRSNASRYNVVEALGRIGPAAKSAVERLRLLLRDHDERVADEAAAALGAIDARIAPLVERLGDPRPEARERAIKLLSKIGAQAAPALEDAVVNRRGYVREGALVALGGVKPISPSATRVIGRLLSDDNQRIRTAAVGAVDAMGPDGVECLDALMTALRKADCTNSNPFGGRPEDWQCLGGEAALEKMAANPASSSKLAEFSGDPDPAIAALASKALGKGGPTALPAVLHALADPRLEVALAAAYGLAPTRFGDQAAELLPALEALPLRTVHSEYREDACRIVGQAIAWFGGSRAEDALGRLVANPEQTGCSRSQLLQFLKGSQGAGPPAAAALEERPQARASGLMVLLQNSKGPYQTEGLLKQLAELGPAAVDATPYLTSLVEQAPLNTLSAASSQQQVACAAIQVLVRTGPSGVKVALKALDRATPEARRDVVSAMWGMGPGAELAVPRLLELGRTAVVGDDGYTFALAYAGSYAIPGLIEALADPANAPLAISALSRMNPRSTPVRHLTDVAETAPDAVAAGAIRALGQIGRDGSPAVDRLIAWFSRLGVACATRAEVPGALASIGDPRGFPIIERGLQDPCKDVQLASVRALAKAGPLARGAAAALTALSRDPDPGLAKEVLTTLGALGPLAGVAEPTLAGVLEDEHAPSELRVGAAEALGHMGDAAQSAAPTLARMLASADQRLRAAASDALQHLSSSACGASAEAVTQLQRSPQSWDVINALRFNRYLASCAALGLSKLLAVSDSGLRATVIAILAEAGEGAEPAVPALANLLGEGRDPVLPIVKTLGNIGPASIAASSQLAARLEDPSAEVRRATVDAVRLMGVVDARLAQAMLRLARSDGDSHDTRFLAMAGLASLRRPEALPVLEELLKDKDPQVACSAASVLGDYGPSAHGALGALEALRQRATTCRQEALDASIEAIRQ